MNPHDEINRAYYGVRREDLPHTGRTDYKQLQLEAWLGELAAYRATGLSPEDVAALTAAMAQSERLTYKSENDEHWYLKDGVTVRGFDKLAAYENTGLTPAQVVALVALIREENP